MAPRRRPTALLSLLAASALACAAEGTPEGPGAPPAPPSDPDGSTFAPGTGGIDTGGSPTGEQGTTAGTSGGEAGDSGTGSGPVGPTRIVAIGDFHGDLGAARTALQLADAVDDQDQWIGGEMVVVQLGDQLDRGDDERAIVDLLTRLEAEAADAGGALHVLNGNHEVINIDLDFRYVTDAGWRDFDDVPGLDLDDPRLGGLDDAQKHRGAAFVPGGPYAMVFASRRTVLQLGDNVFVHGGVTPAWASYGLDAVNADVSSWMRGDTQQKPASVSGENSVVWSRHYSMDTDAEDCTMLEQTLDILGAERMVVAHTVQSYINSACNDRVWRVDVGMADYYGGMPQVLEIVDGVVQVIAS